jgi:excinuclease ABC subunit C
VNGFKSLSREIIVPFELDIEENERIKFTIPKLGEKKKLLELSQKNVAFF